jgi:hypothetical protein
MSLTISDLHYLQRLVPDNRRRKLLSVLGKIANQSVPVHVKDLSGLFGASRLGVEQH